MQKLKKTSWTIFCELALLTFGVFIILASSAFILRLFVPLSHDYYAFELVGSTIAGFVTLVILFYYCFSKLLIERKVCICIGAFSVAIAFQVIIPLALERSITVFLLGTISEHPDGIMKAKLEQDFQDGYVKGHNMLQKRLNENTFSGNLIINGNKIILTPRGRAIVTIMSVTGRVFSVPLTSSTSNPL